MLVKLIFTISMIIGIFNFPVYATTSLYADGDVSTGSHNGTAANPFQTLQTSPAWVIINAALVSDDVTVYVSCREVGSDVSDVLGEIVINRTDTSSHRLTLDGMTKWNISDSSPSWMDYGGSPTRLTSKAGVVNNGEGWSIGWGGNPPIATFDNVTVRGFESTGSSARFRFEGGGNNFIIEYNYVHDITGGGPGMTFNSGAYAYSTGPTLVNPAGCGNASCVCTLRIDHLSNNVIVQYNVINMTADEGFYFGGNGATTVGGVDYGFDCPGHTNIQFLYNTISNPGQYGIGEGDCFDLKNGNTNITYRGNIVGPCSRNGIPIMGAAISYRPQNVIVEQNLIHDTDTSMGGSGAINIINTWSTVPDTVHIQSNIIYNGWLLAYDGSSDTVGDGAKYSVYIDNNTVDNGLIVAKYVHTGSIRNNIVLRSASSAIDYAQVFSFTESNNAVYTTGPGGSGDITLNAGQVTVLFTNRAGHDYTIASTSSQAYHTGIDISPSFSDYNNHVFTSPWDLGAIKFTTSGSFTVSPLSANLNGTYTLIATGSDVNWTQDFTSASFSGSGVTVNSTLVTSATSASINITISAGAAVGLRTITITTTAHN